MLIKEKRKALGLTQKQLEEKLGLKPTLVQKWEAGKAMPRADTLLELAKILGTTTDEILKDFVKNKKVPCTANT